MTTWVRQCALVYLDRVPAPLVDQSKASANILGGYVLTYVVQENTSPVMKWNSQLWCSDHFKYTYTSVPLALVAFLYGGSCGYHPE